MPKAARALGDDFGPGQRRGVEADLVRARAQEDPHVVDGADAAADGQRHEAAVRRALDHVDDRFASLGGSGDVEEDEFVRALVVVADGQLDRIADIAQAVVLRPAELLAAGDAAVMDVEAGDDAFGEHGTFEPKARGAC